MMEQKWVKEIKELNNSFFEDIRKWRRHFHQFPELSYEEHKTASYVAQQLKAMDIPFKTGVAGTGIVAEIKGLGNNPKTIALRGDMDALPIQEENNVEYKSQVPGVMHACGHDVHTSSLLGCAYILQQLKDKFEGTVRLLFQPGEEKAPGGASIMIEEGVLKNPTPKAIFGQHVMPYIEAGKVGFRSGKYMASVDELYITVRGKGGHGAMPQYNIDPVTCTAHIITALQQVVSRRAHPQTPTVLSIGKIIANGATNIIPNTVYLEGTFRTMDDQWREEAKKIMVKMAKGIAESMDCTIDFFVEDGYPFLHNDEVVTERAKLAAEQFLGKENIEDLDIWMASEDFAFFSQAIPGCFYRLGTGNKEKGITASVHTPIFDIDEDVLKISSGLMAYLAVNELQS